MGLTLRSKTIERVNTGHSVVEELACPNSEMTAQQDGLIDAAHGDYSGLAAPLCMRVQAIEHGYRSGEARIVAQYRTPTWPEWLLRNVNKAILFRRRIQSEQPYRRDLDDVLIEGQDEDTAADRTWVKDSGENFGIRPKHFIIIQAVVDDKAVYVDAFDGKEGDINEGLLLNIYADSEAGHLLFMGVDSEPILADTVLHRVSYAFMHHSLEWNSQLIIKQYETIFKSFPIYGYFEGFGGTFVSGSESKWLTAPTGLTRTPRLFETSDFSRINDMF